MKQQKLSIVLIPFLLGFANALSGQNGGLVSDQIADHFEQVFSPHSKSSIRDRENWLPGDEEKQNPFGVDIELHGSLTFVEDAGVSVSDEKHSAHYYEASYTLSYPLKPGKSIGLVVGHSEFILDNKAPDLVPVLGYSEAMQLDVGLMYNTNLSPRWDAFFGGGCVYSNGDSDAHKSAFNAFIFAGVSYIFSPNLTISTGGMLSTNAAYNDTTVDLFMLEYRINDRNRLSIRNGIFYQYALTKDWRNIIGLSVENFYVMVELDKNHYRWGLDDPTQVIRDNSLKLTYEHRFKDGFILECKLGLGHFVSHSVVDDGDVYEDTELDHSLGFSLGVSKRF